LRFPLVADVGGELSGKLGVIKDYGTYGPLARRVTFLLDREAIVRATWSPTSRTSRIIPVRCSTPRALSKPHVPSRRADAGHLVQQAECAPKIDADGIETRITIDRSCGCQALVQSVVSSDRAPRQRSAMAGHEQSLFVLSGTATLYLDGHGHHELEPDSAAYIASGESYSIENDGPEPLVALIVDAPTPDDADRPSSANRRVTVNFATQPDLEAGIGARSACSSTPNVGCSGFHPVHGRDPGRPRARSQPHLTTRSSTWSPAMASCTWVARRARSVRAPASTLPPLHLHCLENAGDGPMRVLGVFQPAGSPAARYAEEA